MRSRLLNEQMVLSTRRGGEGFAKEGFKESSLYNPTVNLCTLM